MLRFMLIAAASLWLAAPARGQTMIELRSSARVPADAPVTLADIAQVTGDDAATLSPVVIEADPAARAAGARYFDLQLQTVRAALTKAGARWGKTTLRGSSCSIVVVGAASPETADAAPRRAPSTPQPIDTAGPPTVRLQAARALARMHGVELTDLRVAFEPQDEELLSTTLDGRRAEIQPTNAPGSSLVGLRIYLFSSDRLLQQRTISVQVLVRRTIVTAVGVIQRRQAITADDIAASEQWAEPTAAACCTPEQAIGSIARSRINAGQTITLAGVEAPIIVRKGDLVEVHCLAGAVHLKASHARALEPGHDGDVIEFRLDGSSRKFKARLSGRGSAVLVLDAPASPTTTDR